MSRAASGHDPAIGLCQGTPLQNEIEARDPRRLGEATNKAAEAATAQFGSSAVQGRMLAYVIAGQRV